MYAITIERFLMRKFINFAQRVNVTVESNKQLIQNWFGRNGFSQKSYLRWQSISHLHYNIIRYLIVYPVNYWKKNCICVRLYLIIVPYPINMFWTIPRYKHRNNWKYDWRKNSTNCSEFLFNFIDIYKLHFNILEISTRMEYLLAVKTSTKYKYIASPYHFCA